MFFLVWHARSTLQTPLALWGPLEALQNNKKNRSILKMTVSEQCNLQYLISKVVCATACFFLVWHARSTLQTQLAVWVPLEALQNSRRNRSTVNMAVSKPCNLQYLVSKEVCATGWFFFVSMRDLRGMHVGRVTPSGDYISLYIAIWRYLSTCRDISLYIAISHSIKEMSLYRERYGYSSLLIEISHSI